MPAHGRWIVRRLMWGWSRIEDSLDLLGPNEGGSGAYFRRQLKKVSLWCLVLVVSFVSSLKGFDCESLETEVTIGSWRSICPRPPFLPLMLHPPSFVGSCIRRFCQVASALFRSSQSVGFDFFPSTM